MTARELRIGNYVYECLVQKDIIRVDIDTLQFNCELIEPIPLTEEWLLNLGFEKVNSCYEEAKTFDFVLQPLYFDMANQSIKINGVYQKISYPKYVHQLQNLFYCLCGEELQIQNL